MELIVPPFRPDEEKIIQDMLFGDYLEIPQYKPIEHSTCMRDFLEKITAAGRQRLSIVELERIDRKFKENLTIELQKHLSEIVYSSLKGKIFCFFLTCFTVLTLTGIYLKSIQL